MPLRLIAVDDTDPKDRVALVAFVNAHYASELPLDEKPLVQGHLKMFWARDDVDGRDTVVGVTGYVKKTPYLAESVKTVMDPAFRGRGLGVQLSQAIEDEVRRAGFKKVMSTILIGNIPMIVIKLRQGFIIEGIHMDHEKPGLHEYSLGKVLR
jgi:RimJ/RimL family protein N-acetyltransferase